MRRIAKCGVCERLCPAEALTIREQAKTVIPSLTRASSALSATTCADACPTNSIVYSKGRPKSAKV